MAKKYLPLPKGTPLAFESGKYEDVYDATIEGVHHRWRTMRGTRRVVAYIEYDHDPEFVKANGGVPWKKLWTSTSWDSLREIRTSAYLDAVDALKSRVRHART